MKRLIPVLAFITALFFTTSLQAQTVKQVFNTAFPEVTGSLKIDSTTKYDPAKKYQYRKLFYKLSGALDEIKSFEIGAAQPDYMKYFDYKDLKKLSKDNKLDSLRLLIHQEQNKIADLMRYEQWGADTLRAINNYQGFRNNFKSKNFDDAYKNWRVLFHEYPKATRTIYTAGAIVVKYKLKKAKDSLERAKWADTLMMVYDQYMKLYPERKLSALSKKVVDYYTYFIKPYDVNDSLIRLRVEQDYKWAKEAVKLGGDKTPPYIYPVAMPLSFYMYKMKKISPEQFVDDYMQFSDNLRIWLDSEKDPKKAQQIKQFISMVDKVFTSSELATCDNYEKVFGAHYDSLKTDVEFLKKILTLMSREGCIETDFFEKVAIDLYNQEPSAESAYTLSKLLASKDKMDEALKYAEEAINLKKEDDTLKAEYYFNAAKIYNKLGNFSKARSYAYKALELRPNWGDPYILIATMYAVSAPNCGKDDFQHNAVYWAAVDKLIQAKNADPSMADKINELISTYSAHYPEKKDGFMHSAYEGDTYNIDYCWINETTKVRYLK